MNTIIRLTDTILDAREKNIDQLPIPSAVKKKTAFFYLNTITNLEFSDLS